MAIAVERKPELASPTSSIYEIPLSAITPAPDNPRRDIGDVAELAASMGELGMLQPLVVTPRKGKFMVVCGHRRHAAAKIAKLATAPAIVRDLDEPQRIKAMLIENCQRTDLTPLEEARAYQQLVDLGLTQRQICADVGKSQGHISKRLALLELTPAAQKELDSDGITLEDASHLLELRGMPKRADAALKEGKRYRSIDRAVRDQLADHERAEKAGTNLQHLKQQGIRIVQLVRRDQWSHQSIPKGMAKLVGARGYAYTGELAIDPKSHAGEPCHAAAINEHDGTIMYVCTTPSNHKTKSSSTASPTEKAAAAKAREKERADMLRARERNLELGAELARKFRAPKIDARNMRFLIDVLLDRYDFGDELAHGGLRFIDEASQTVVTRKDGSVSRITHADHPSTSREILDRRLADAKTPEEIMGVLLQAFIACTLVDKTAVPASQRYGNLSFLIERYGAPKKNLKTRLEQIAGAIGKKKAT